jgi:hypothetical protein
MGKGSDALGPVSGYEIQGPRPLFRGEASRRITWALRHGLASPPYGLRHPQELLIVGGLPRDITANSGLSVSATTEVYQAQFRGF